MCITLVVFFIMVLKSWFLFSQQIIKHIHVELFTPHTILQALNLIYIFTVVISTLIIFIRNDDKNVGKIRNLIQKTNNYSLVTSSRFIIILIQYFNNILKAIFMNYFNFISKFYIF